MKHIGILGGGISGLTLAYFLNKSNKVKVTVLEKEERMGGLCRTFEKDNFGYDIGGHIMFSKDEATLKEMVGLLGSNIKKRRRNAKIYFKGRQVKYPFENDLAALSKEDNFECLNGFINNPMAEKEPKDFREWIYHTFGKGIAEKFMIPYNQKIWKAEPEDLSLSWVGRIPKPPTEDVIKSALGIKTEGLKHQLYYYYPIKGGYESVVKALIAKVVTSKNVSLVVGTAVNMVNKENDKWRARTTSGEEYVFDDLVSTLPPQVFVKLVSPHVPTRVEKAIAAMRYNSLVMVMLGYDKKVCPGVLSFNIPDPEFLSHRICFPKSFSPKLAPSGCGSVAAEITARPESDLYAKSDVYFKNHVASWLEKEGIVSKKHLKTWEVHRLDYAYVVYDMNYSKNREIYINYLEKIGVIGLGRFGRFIYINSDVCFAEAKTLAKQLIKEL